MNFFKRLTCEHLNASVISWSWVFEPPSVRIKYKCTKCGKIQYIYIHGDEAKEWAEIMGTYKLV